MTNCTCKHARCPLIAWSSAHTHTLTECGFGLRTRRWRSRCRPHTRLHIMCVWFSNIKHRPSRCMSYFTTMQWDDNEWLLCHFTFPLHEICLTMSLLVCGLRIIVKIFCWTMSIVLRIFHTCDSSEDVSTSVFVLLVNIRGNLSDFVTFYTDPKSRY